MTPKKPKVPTRSGKTTVKKNPKPRQTSSQRSLGKVLVQLARLNGQMVKLNLAVKVHVENHPILPPVQEDS